MWRVAPERCSTDAIDALVPRLPFFLPLSFLAVLLALFAVLFANGKMAATGATATATAPANANVPCPVSLFLLSCCLVAALCVALALAL